MSRTLSIVLDGEPLEVPADASLGAALLAAGRLGLRPSPRLGSPRGLFCGMGLCFECCVTVDGLAGQRACLTPLREGMVVERGLEE